MNIIQVMVTGQVFLLQIGHLQKTQVCINTHLQIARTKSFTYMYIYRKIGIFYILVSTESYWFIHFIQTDQRCEQVCKRVQEPAVMKHHSTSAT